MKRRYQPWKKGSGQVVPFPVPPIRCWHVQPVKELPGMFRGVLLGMEWEDYEGPDQTEQGPAEMVVRAVRDLWQIRGLPIVVGDVA